MNRSRPPAPTGALRTLLNRLNAFAVVRNEDIFANFERGGDADLLVDDVVRAERVLLECLGEPLVIQRRSYVSGYY
jgi:hypothetical protein